MLLTRRLLRSCAHLRRSCSSSSDAVASTLKELRDLPRFGLLRVAAQRPLALRSLDLYQFPNSDAMQLLSPAGASCAQESSLALTSNGAAGCRLDTGPPSAAAPAQQSLLLCMPLQYDLEVSMATDDVLSVDTLENHSVSIRSQSGRIVTRNVKSGRIDVLCVDASIKANKLLQGNLSIESQNCIMTTDKVQGADIRLKAQNSIDLSIASLYCTDFTLTAAHAKVHLGVAHGNLQLDIEESGTVRIDSLEGSLSLRLRKGDVTVHLMKHQSVEIDVAEGNVTLSVPADVSTALDLRADEEVRVDAALNSEQLANNFTPAGQHTFGQLGMASTSSDSNWCSASTREGTVSLKVKEWTGGLNFDFLK